MGEHPAPNMDIPDDFTTSDLSIDDLFASIAAAGKLSAERLALVSRSENFQPSIYVPSHPTDVPSVEDQLADMSFDAIRDVYSAVYSMDGFDLDYVPSPREVGQPLRRFNGDASPAEIFTATAQHFNNVDMFGTIWNETVFKCPQEKRINDALHARKLSEYELKFANRYEDKAFYEQEDIPEPFIMLPPLRRSKSDTKKIKMEESEFDFGE